VAALALIAWPAATFGASGSAPPAFLYGAGCIEHQGFVDGNEAAVAARLPRRYTPVRDTVSGRPLLFVRAMRCRRALLGRTARPLTMASYGVVIESPDGKGCGSAAPGAGSVKGDVPPICNWYVLSWLFDNRRAVRWLRSGTPRFPAFYVPGLSLQLGAFDTARGGAPFHFSAPAPAPSPFTMDEIARERPGELAVRVGYWYDTPQGTVKVAGSTDDLTSGEATGTIRTRRGSQLARLVGAPERSYLAPYTEIGAERIGHGAYRKQLMRRTRRSHRFSGSCSLQGLVTFSPPATNTPAPLAYGYDARGTCTGTLDGRRVSDAPVAVRQAGRAEGACTRAHTTVPGRGTIAFPGGVRIRYTLDFTAVATEVDGTIYGERSGSARLHATFLTQRTPPDVPVRCAGSGARQVPMDLTFATDAALVNTPARKRRRGR
jgi:hypothetical protein